MPTPRHLCHNLARTDHSDVVDAHGEAPYLWLDGSYLGARRALHRHLQEPELHGRKLLLLGIGVHTLLQAKDKACGILSWPHAVKPPDRLGAIGGHATLRTFSVLELRPIIRGKSENNAYDFSYVVA